MWKGLQLSSGQTPDPPQGSESSCPGTSSPTPSCPVLLRCGISPLWLLSSCPRVRLGGLAQPSAWVSLWRLPPPATLLEVPRCVSLAGEFGGAGFILLSPGLGNSIYSVNGRRAWPASPILPDGSVSPIQSEAVPGRGGVGTAINQSLHSTSAPVTLPRGKTDRKSHPGERQRLSSERLSEEENESQYPPTGSRTLCSLRQFLNQSTPFTVSVSLNKELSRPGPPTHRPASLGTSPSL